MACRGCGMSYHPSQRPAATAMGMIPVIQGRYPLGKKPVPKSVPSPKPADKDTSTK